MSQNQNYDGTERGVTRRDALRYLAASAAGALVGCNAFSPRYGHPDRTEPNGFERKLAESANAVLDGSWRETHRAQLDIVVDAELRAVKRGSLGRKIGRLNKGEYAFIGVDFDVDPRTGEYPHTRNEEFKNFERAHLNDPRHTWGNGTGHRSFGASLVQNGNQSLKVLPQLKREVIKQLGEERIVGYRSGARADELEPIIEDVHGQRRMIVLAGEDCDRTNLVGIFDTQELYGLYRARELALKGADKKGLETVDSEIYAAVDLFAEEIKALYSEQGALRGILENIVKQQGLRPDLGIHLDLSRLPKSELYVLRLKDSMPSDYLHSQVVRKANDVKLENKRFDLLADEVVNYDNVLVTEDGRFNLEDVTKGKREIAVLGHTNALARAGVPYDRMFPDLSGDDLQMAVASNIPRVAVVSETEWRKTEETLWHERSPRRISEHPPKVRTPSE